jgi:hypothetical protein
LLMPSEHRSSRRDIMIIARRFNAGWEAECDKVPKGRLNGPHVLRPASIACSAPKVTANERQCTRIKLSYPELTPRAGILLLIRVYSRAFAVFDLCSYRQSGSPPDYPNVSGETPAVSGRHRPTEYNEGCSGVTSSDVPIYRGEGGFNRGWARINADQAKE